jgi:hypothetical protein
LVDAELNRQFPSRELQMLAGVDPTATVEITSAPNV